MATWMKKTFNAEGVTEYPPGPNLAQLSSRFGGSGAVVLCIDVSGSMAGNRLREAIKGGSGFIDDAAEGGYEVGLILWDNVVQKSVAPTKDGKAVAAELSRAMAGGGTTLTPALEHAHRLLTATGADDQVCVVFTDGGLFDQDEAVKAAARLKADGIRVLTIGLGAAAARGLARIASEDAPETTTTSDTTLATDMKNLATGLTMRPRSQR